ncbi:MAG: hypothetical protein Q7U05_15220 [Polaromonas sp.]|nr:hypothetical protein [Polaromonas sp.]
MDKVSSFSGVDYYPTRHSLEPAPAQPLRQGPAGVSRQTQDDAFKFCAAEIPA